MKERKLDRILEAVRSEPPPAPPGDFDERVMRQVRREPSPEALSFEDHLDVLFPKLASAAMAAIALCTAGDLLLGALDLPEVADGAAQISNQWLFPETGI